MVVPEDDRGPAYGVTQVLASSGTLCEAFVYNPVATELLV